MSRSVVFVTGATGRFGRELLPRLIKEWPSAELLLLMRCHGRQSARQRFDALVARLPVGARRTWVEGALERPLFGLEQGAFDDLGRRLTQIVHLAPPTLSDQLEHVAAGSPRAGSAALLKLARAAQEAGTLRRLDLASCVLVAGLGALGFDEESPPVLAEHELPWMRARAESEAWWREQAKGLPLGVHRLGLMASADSPLFRALARVPRGLTAGRLDVIPVEQAASALAALLGAQESCGTTTHLAAGSARSLALPKTLVPAAAAALSGRHALRCSSFALLRGTRVGALYQDRDWSDWDDAKPLLALLAQPKSEVSTARTDALLRRLGHTAPGFR